MANSIPERFGQSGKASATGFPPESPLPEPIANVSTIALIGVPPEAQATGETAGMPATIGFDDPCFVRQARAYDLAAPPAHPRTRMPDPGAPEWDVRCLLGETARILGKLEGR